MQGSMKPAVDLAIGPIEVTRTVTVTWGLILGLTALAWWVKRNLREDKPGRVQTALEGVIEYLNGQIREIIGREPEPFLPLIATLFIFILLSNLLGVFPSTWGLASPTGDIAATSALAIIVFFAVPYYGIRDRGLVGYLSMYVKPFWPMLPLNIISELSRTLALAVRLFGNVMSGGVIVGVLISIGAFFFDIPIKCLGLITSVVQAYIFAVLVMVYIGGAVRSTRGKKEETSG